MATATAPALTRREPGLLGQTVVMIGGSSAPIRVNLCDTDGGQQLVA